MAPNCIRLDQDPALLDELLNAGAETVRTIPKRLGSPGEAVKAAFAEIFQRRNDIKDVRGAGMMVESFRHTLRDSGLDFSHGQFVACALPGSRQCESDLCSLPRFP
ncbi:hypothetical protein GCM10027456_81730 [Kineosporia babensis]